MMTNLSLSATIRVASRRTLLILCACTLYMSLSGFECASTEMTTARLALQQKDYKRAEEFFRKEVTARPQNAEAWRSLGDLYLNQNRYTEMLEAFSKAEAGTLSPLTPADKENIAIQKYNAWLTLYKQSYSQYSKDTPENLQAALLTLDTAGKVLPGHPETIYLRATVYSGLKDDASALDAYDKYTNLVQGTVDRGTDMGLRLGLSAREVEAKLGPPTRQTPPKEFDESGGYAYYPTKDLYVYYYADFKTNTAARVEGWKFYGAADPTPQLLRQATVAVRSTPYYKLAAAAFRAGEKDKSKYSDALKYFQVVAKLDPATYPQVGQLITDLYIRSGREDEARKAIEKEITLHPDDPMLYINYGNLLFNMKDLNGAADKFKKAWSKTTSDPKGEAAQLALFNLGAVYKNIGAVKQDSIRKVSNGKPSAAQIEVFRDPLRESLKYFEQLRAAKADVDYSLMVELANLYDVLGDKPKMKQLISDMEALEKTRGSDKEYWSAMTKLYVAAQDIKKAEEADKKSR